MGGSSGGNKYLIMKMRHLKFKFNPPLADRKLAIQDGENKMPVLRFTSS